MNKLNNFFTSTYTKRVCGGKYKYDTYYIFYWSNRHFDMR